MKMKFGWLVLAALFFASPRVFSQDTNFFIFLCFGQSNMEGFPGVQEQDKTNVDSRFQVLAAVDFPQMGRKKGTWYTAVPPLCRPGCGLCPADYFGRTLVSNLPPNVKVGVVNVAVAGCKIEMFDKTNYQSYIAGLNQQSRYQANIATTYGGSPYQCLVDMGKLAQKDGVIKGILLHQGESNANDRQWPNKVKAIYDDLIKDLNLNPHDVPLLAGEMVNQSAGLNKIMEQDLPKTLPNSYVISSAGCAGRGDNLHFSPAGYRELGTRYGLQMLSLLGYKPAQAEAK